MQSSVRPSTEQRLLEYVLMHRLGTPDAVPLIELTSTVQYAIDAKLPNTLATLLRELGRRGGLVVSVQLASQTAAQGRDAAKTPRRHIDGG